MKLHPFSLAIALLILSNTQSTAQNSGTAREGSFSLVTNLPYFILGGYHLKPSYHFPKQWSIGVTAQGGFELPEFARDQFFKTSNEDITVDWKYAIGAELKYRFSEAAFDKGFYAAFNIGFEGWEVKNVETREFDNWFASVDLGYNWYPFKKKRFHVGLAYALIFILNITNEQLLDGATYNIRSVVPPTLTPTLLLGWRF